MNTSLSPPIADKNAVTNDLVILMADDYSDPVVTYFGKIVSKQHIIPSSSFKSFAIEILKTGAIIIGTLSGIPYIAPAMKFAGDNKIAGYILGYGVSASLAVVTVWALLDIVDSIQSNKDASHLLPKNTRSCIKEATYWTLVSGLGISSAFPVAYLIYTYNSSQLALVGMSLSTDSITNTCSLNRLYQDLKIYTPYINRQKVKNIERARWQFIHQLNIAIQVLINLPTEELESILSAMQALNFNPKDLLQHLVILSNVQLVTEASHPIWYHGLPMYTVKITSAVFPLAWAVFGVINSYISFGELFNNTFWRWSVAIITTFPYLFLEMTLAVAVFSETYKLLIGSAFGIRQQSIAQKYYPQSFYIMTSLGLLTTSCSFGSRAEFVTTEIKGNLGVALAVIVCISTVAYKSSAMLDMIKLVLEKIIIRFGENTHKDLCKLVNGIREFNDVLKDVEPQKLQDFFHSLNNQELIDMLSEDHSSDEDQLQRVHDDCPDPDQRDEALLVSPTATDVDSISNQSTSRWPSFWSKISHKAKREEPAEMQISIRAMQLAQQAITCSTEGYEYLSTHSDP